MKIKSVKIENLRSFKEETILFNDYTCLVGPNGAGKSTVICALNIFFRESDNSSTDLLNLQEEDFHDKKTAEPIRVTVTFNDLNAEAQEDFKGYFRQGELVVSAEATYDIKSKNAAVKQYGQRNAMKALALFFEALGDGKPVKELKIIYESLRKTIPELPAPGTKDAMTEALRAYETKHPEQCELIPSPDEFYGVSKGTNRLAKYLQWVFVPAVKDAASEQTEAKNTALGKLLARAVRSKVNFAEDIDALRTKTQEAYEKLLADKQGALTELSTALCKRLADWAHPDALLKLAWRQDQDKSVRVEDPLAEIIAGESGFEGSLSRFGHGLQRSYLLVLLQELASSDDANSPRLVLACEEPELYQHPPQMRHLAEVLQKLSGQNTQVIICTHSPYFVTGQDFESVRLVRKPRGTTASRVAFVKMDKLSASLAKAWGNAKPAAAAGVLAKIHQELQPAINEIFFTPALVLVEGLEDVAYITTYLHLTDKWKDYRRLGCHLVPANGKSHIVQPLAVTIELGIPTFVVFDSDAHETKSENRAKHERDNKAILTLCDCAAAVVMPADNFWSGKCVMWKSELGEVVKADFNANELDPFMEKARINCGHIGGLEKNQLFIADFLTEAWNAGKKSQTLEKLCTEIIGFAKKAAISA